MTMTITRPTPAAAPTATAQTDRGCYVTVNPNGRLSILDSTAGVPVAAALARRSIGGIVYRVPLTAGITAWLDGDDQDGTGELNWAATEMCAALATAASGHGFTGPHDLPFVCGPVLFTTSAPDATMGLSDQQLALLTDAHAAVEHPDTDVVASADIPDWDR